MSRNTILVAAIVAALGLGAALWVTFSPEAPTGGSAGVAPTPAPAPAATSSSSSVPLGTAPVTPAPPQPAPAPSSLAVTPSPAPAATTMAAPSATAGSGGEEAESVAAVVTEPAASAPTPSIATPVVPSFDIVRVERDGSTIVAGRAAPGSVVVLYDGETSIAEVTAGSDGSFVILLDQPLEPGSRRLSLGASEAGAPQVLSNDEVVVVVPEPAAVETAAAEAAAPAPAASAPAPSPAPVAAATPGPSPAPQTASDSAGESASGTASEATAEAVSETAGEAASATDSAAAGDAAAASEVGTSTEDATASEAAATEEAVASATKTAEAVPSAGAATVPETAAATPAPAPAEPLVIVTSRDGSGPSVVLQGASGELAGDDLRIEAVDYDLEGEVIVSGRGPAGGTVVLYIDDKAVGQVAVAADGRWSITPEGNVATGLHRLRADLHDAAGTVSARVEIPFSRAAPIAVAASEKLIVVQPGHSLWVIAHGHYGEGLRYTAIYEANKGQIRDEDLIYPGQIFLVPSVN